MHGSRLWWLWSMCIESYASSSSRVYFKRLAWMFIALNGLLLTWSIFGRFELCLVTLINCDLSWWIWLHLDIIAIWFCEATPSPVWTYPQTRRVGHSFLEVFRTELSYSAFDNNTRWSRPAWQTKSTPQASPRAQLPNTRRNIDEIYPNTHQI